MDRVTRCLHCGKLMVPAPSYTGRTELKCVFCDKLDPMEMAQARQWSESPLAMPITEPVVENPLTPSSPQR
jgi:phage FluMu protein Com